MAKSLGVSDYVITTAMSKQKPVSNLKLQKIMYFLNVIHLLEYKNPLIDDDNFEKWDYGPVIHEVYSEYSSNGSQEIKKPKRHIKNRELINGEYKDEPYDNDFFELNEEDKRFINDNIDSFIDENPFFLVEKTHEEPQWKDKLNYNYDNDLTLKYFENPKNRFWEK
ncbi:Panacea domain-containing protein [Fructilactobacillus florum]|nr:type II toxin-antitoxin system antitoxin SocA domain-containing protein [Fructilactobacillus florum]